MNDLKELLEREAERVDAAPDALDSCSGREGVGGWSGGSGPACSRWPSPASRSRSCPRPSGPPAPAGDAGARQSTPLPGPSTTASGTPGMIAVHHNGRIVVQMEQGAMAVDPATGDLSRPDVLFGNSRSQLSWTARRTAGLPPSSTGGCESSMWRPDARTG